MLSSGSTRTLKPRGSAGRRRRGPRSAIAALLLALLPGVSRGQAASAPEAPAQVRFSYEDAREQPAKYFIVLREDGGGNYSTEAGSTPPANSADPYPAAAQDRSIVVPQALVARIFLLARRSGYFASPCDAGGRGIAFQGLKTLSYRGPDGHGLCTYNWSKSKEILELTSDFEAMALTLELGRKMESEYRHTPLLLDGDLEFLRKAVRQGDALDIASIAPLLQRIASDDSIVDRDRRWAEEILASGK